MDDEITIGCEYPRACRRQRPSLQGIMRLDYDLGGVVAGPAYYTPRVRDLILPQEQSVRQTG